MEHAKYSPSSIARNLRCTGSVTLPQTDIQGTNAAAEEGTLAHELCESYLTGEEFDSSHYTQEMFEGADMYIRFINACCDEGRVHIKEAEKRLEYSAVLFGTTDCVLIVDKTLWIIDYKFGYAVVPPDAEQLKTYAFMALSEFAGQFKIDTIKTAIVQPRVNSEPTVAEHTVESILAFEDKVVATIAQIERGDVEFQLGDHCKYCKSKLHCPEVERVRNDTGKSPQVMTPEELAKRLAEVEGLEHYIKDIKAYSYGQALDGVAIAGHKLVRSNTHRKWADGVEDKLSQFIAADKLYKKTLITPTQALKLNKALPEEYIIKPQGSLTLVPDSDRRKAELPADAMDTLADMLSVH